MEVLVLNSSYEVHQVLPLHKALKLLYKNRADIIESIDNKSISSFKEKIPMPSVIKLTNYCKYQRKPASFNKKNVLMRDNYTCQYCGKKNADTIDHVVPKSKGGKLTWDNSVACCTPCNTKKADLPLSKSGFTLLKQPRQPSKFFLYKYLNRRPEWAKFSY